MSPLARALAAFAAFCLAQAPEGAYFSRANIAAAAREAEARAKTRARDAVSQTDAALLLLDLAEEAKARALLEAAAKAAPKDADVLAELGWARLRARAPSAAAEGFERALRLEPRNPRALLGRARAELDSGKLEEGLRDLDAALAVDPDLTVAHVVKARALLSQGKTQEALDAFNKARKSDPFYFEVRLWMAPLYAQSKKFDQAWRQYMRVANTEPENEEVKRESKRLEGLLSRKPGEIMGAKELPRPLQVRPSKRAGGMPVIRVAVGTTQAGKPAPKQAVAFRSDGAFDVFVPEKKRRILLGGPNLVWIARRIPAGRKGAPGYELIDSRQKRLARFKTALILRPKSARHSILFQRLNVAGGTAWQTVSDRQLKGEVELRVEGDKGLYIVNSLPLEDYVYGVVNEEMPSSFPMEALKAQAILARNHALYSKDALKPHRKDGYDLCDGQHCQVYSGITGENKNGRAACDATRGRVLRWKGELAQTPYSADCGGHTQDSGEVQGWASLPYLRGTPDSDDPGPDGPWHFALWLRSRPSAYCAASKHTPPAHFRWSRLVPADQLAERIKRREDVGRLLSIRVLRRSRSGNVNRVEFVGEKGSLVLDHENSIRTIFGLSAIRSTMFVLESWPGADGKPAEFALYGGGWGHGVGMCQVGAAGRADAGQDARAILTHYFPGAEIGRLGY
ncbi:MAG TPA: SpoIID/LytB domain-containing protein [Elusimicrobiota bacterium]|nr:SpoIID/LytB domain-containing protein [Elusimicrobiota bacterium]